MVSSPDSATPVLRRSTQARVRASAVGMLMAGRVQLRCSTDLVRLIRTGGRVTGSIRVPADRLDPAVATAQRSVEVLARAAAERLTTAAEASAPRAGALVPQSLVATAEHELRLLARLESGCGPLLVGATGADAAERVGELVVRAAETVGDGRTGPPPADWSARPLVLRPPVAAAVLVGLRWLLGTPQAARLDGRRVLPDLTLVDRPTAHPTGTLDDGGREALAQALVRRGRVAMPETDAEGVMHGRALWLHDRGRLVPATPFGLALTGRAFEEPLPAAIELMRCVEGLRRYHPDGTVRLLCLARSLPSTASSASGASSPSTASTGSITSTCTPFLVRVTARPLSLLRAVRGVDGPSEDVCCDHDVRTPSLVLTSTDDLAGSFHALVTAV